jgi:hypothetical protein
MARRKRTNKGEKPDEAQQLPMSYAPEARPDELRVFPFELPPGDLVNVDGREWEVAGHPAVYRQGKMIEVRLHKPGDRSVVRAEHWGAHERVAAKRP